MKRDYEKKLGFFRLAKGYFFLFQIVSVLSNGFSLVKRD